MSTAETRPSMAVPKKPIDNERVVQFKVPESIFNRAKAKALLNGTPWKTFLQNLLEEGGKMDDSLPES